MFLLDVQQGSEYASALNKIFKYEIFEISCSVKID